MNTRQSTVQLKDTEAPLTSSFTFSPSPLSHHPFQKKSLCKVGIGGDLLHVMKSFYKNP